MDSDARYAWGSNAPGDDEAYALRLLERLVAGDGSPADEAALAAWIGSNTKRQRIIDRVRVQWGVMPEAHDADAGWMRVARHLRPVEATSDATSDSVPVAHRPSRPLTLVPPARRSPFRAVAAAAAAAMIATVAFRLGTSPRPVAEAGAPRVYATSTGQRADAYLPDGTHVVIAPESRVRVAADFGAQRRDVYVEGEAYFEVVHDSTRPFTVFAANTSTLDIGTAFAVRSYAEERVVRVVVTEGKVVMSGAGPLVAGDVGLLTEEGKASVRRRVDAAALVGWTRGELVFEDAPLAQVLQDLRRWYGIDMRAADSTVAALPFTGSLRNTSPAEGLALIAATLGLRVTRDGALTVLRQQ